MTYKHMSDYGLWNGVLYYATSYNSGVFFLKVGSSFYNLIKIVYKNWCSYSASNKIQTHILTW